MARQKKQESGLGPEELSIARVQEERFQGPSTRARLYSRLEELLGIPVISLFTSFVYPVVIEDSDADMLEGLLQKCEVPKEFALLLSSPGGYGLAAERIINVCRSYSDKGTYQVIVPGKAKSAATIICLGASKIIMGKTSELGAIDPQAAIKEGDKEKWFSLFNIVTSYESLFEKAVNEKGNLQPYLQQLSNYDARQIAEYKSELSLSEDMAIKTLKTGMLAHLSEDEIKKKIKIFLTPESVKVHGRPIYIKEAKQCGLNIEVVNVKSPLWATVYELYVRLNGYVSTNNVLKCLECKDASFRAGG
jgi:ClpP class serine protease